MEFESIEIRKVKNGFVILLSVEEGTEEYVFATSRQAIKFIKEYVDVKKQAE
jgi:hypothetical protein